MMCNMPFSTLNSLLQQRDGIVEIWKRYTRVKHQEEGGEKEARRIENSTWRLWFREQRRRRFSDASCR
jgi:hypothetical protein